MALKASSEPSWLAAWTSASPTGHLRDALCRRARQSTGHALRSWSLRRGADRRRRRILPNGRQTCIHITAPWPGPRKRACQSAQRKEGKLRRRQCGRRTHHVPRQTRCAVDFGYRRRRPANVPLGAHIAQLLDVAADGATAAIEAATQAPGQIATLILPADTAWGPAEKVVTARPTSPRAKVNESAVKGAAEMLSNGKKTTLLLAGPALTEEGLQIAGRIAGKTGCGL